MPEGYFAMSEVDSKAPIPDVLALGYARRADHLSVYLPQGELIAVIEILSRGNKDNKNGFTAFVRKAGKLLRSGVHLLVVDLFPPSARDPHGIHKLIWGQFKDEPFELPPDKPLTLEAYAAGSEKVADIENVAIGDRLADMPIFLTPDHYVPCPLEASYQVTWGVFPAALKGPLEPSPK
jgi:Protein of unknown function (DUF4058)